MNITLYHYWRSSSSWRVRWALEYKKVPYKSVHVDLLNGENEAEEHLRRNPFGWVPALEMHGQVFIESLAMLEWLEEIMPSPALYPGDPMGRMHIRGLAEIINAGTQPVQNLTVLDFYSPDVERRKQWSQHFIRRGLKTFEKQVTGSAGKFSVGDHLSAADLCLIPQCYNALRNEMTLEEFPTIERIYKNALDTPSCQASAPDKFKPRD